MNPSQQNAVKTIHAFLERQRDTDPERQDTVSMEVSAAYQGAKILFVSADIVMLGLPESNLLRFVAQQHWLFCVRSRGAIDVLQAPKAFHQFKGGRAFGMNFKAA